MQQPVTDSTLNDWLTRDAIPFALAAPDSCNTAVDQLVAALGETVTLLGFGEALHVNDGAGDAILRLRNRLFQRLVARHGYCALAIESSFPRGYLVNAYVLGHGPRDFAAIAESGFSHGFGRLTVNRELIEWMRAYNADLAHQVKLHFYGFDGPMEMMNTDSPRQLLTIALDYLDAFDPAAGATQRARIEPLLGADAAWENPQAMMDATQSVGLSPAATALRIAVEEFITALQMSRPTLVQASDAAQLATALHAATAARHLLTYHAVVAGAAETRLVDLLALRDLMMAENLAHIVAQEQGRGKVLVFAHNSHLRKGRAEWQWGPHFLRWWPAGAQVAAMLGERYQVIGAAVGSSPVNGIGAPEAGTLEAQLMAAPGPVRFVPTHGGQGLPATALVDH